jgi:hypothetical protein
MLGDAARRGRSRGVDAQPRVHRSGPGWSAVAGVAEGEVAGAEGEFVDLQVGDVSGQ